MSDNFIPAEDPAKMKAASGAMVRATTYLVGLIASHLDPAKQDCLNALLAGGGRIGIETSFDQAGGVTIQLVAIELEGSRRILATMVESINQPRTLQ